MTLSDSFPNEDAGGLSIADTRLIFAGMVARSSSGAPRLGILPFTTAALVTGTAGMAYSVGAFVAATSRNGTGIELVSNDGALSVSTTAAPGSNSRIDVIWVRCRFATYGDGVNIPEIGVTQGTASLTPTKPAIPTGALELATAVVTSSDVATTTTVITQTTPFTAAAGGTLWARNSTDLGTYTPADGALALRIDTGVTYRRTGGAWKAWESDWLSYTPTFAGYTGNAPTVAGKYKYQSGRVKYPFSVAIVSGTSLSGTPTITMPVPPVLPRAYHTFGGARAAVLSASSRYEAVIFANNLAASLILAIPQTSSTAAAAWSNSVPKSLSAGDTFEGELEYDF